MLNAVFIIRGFNGISRPLLALIIMFSLVCLMTEKIAILFLMRYRWRLQRRSAVWRVLLVGSREDAENYFEVVRFHPEWNLEIVDVISPSSDGTAARRSDEHLYSPTER
jgi:FlaA1/EpsC-like NDP-sugar epimerase